MTEINVEQYIMRLKTKTDTLAHHELCIIQLLTLNMKNERLELEHCISTGASESRNLQSKV